MLSDFFAVFPASDTLAATAALRSVEPAAFECCSACGFDCDADSGLAVGVGLDGAVAVRAAGAGLDGAVAVRAAGAGLDGAVAVRDVGFCVDLGSFSGIRYLLDLLAQNIFFSRRFCAVYLYYV